MKAKGRVFQRGSRWWIAYYLHGKEFRESARTDDPKKAEKFLQHRLNETGAAKIGAKVFVTPLMRRVWISALLDSLERDLKLRRQAQRGQPVAAQDRTR